MAEYIVQDSSFWLSQQQVIDAETKYYMALAAKQYGAVPCTSSVGSSLASEIEKARNQIKQSLKVEGGDSGVMSVSDSQVINRIVTLERENQELRKVTSDLQAAVKKLEVRLSTMETGASKSTPALSSAPAKPAVVADDDDDDDVDLFGSDDESEDEETERLKEERLKDYANRKAKKPALIAKSNIILDVKPWDDETDMKELEKCVRSVAMDGLLWGTAKLVPVGYGIKKLQISCVVEDDKVSTDDLEEQITAFEDFIQSVDIAAFNKV